MIRRLSVLAALVGTAAIAGCSGNPDRFSVTPPQASAQQRIAFRAVEIRKISLPGYAAADEIALQDPSGKVVENDEALWADSPERAIGLELSRHLARITNARIASEPWPFEAYPDARLELRFAELVANTQGVMRAEGQYFVSATNGGRERSGLFDLSVNFDPNGGPPAIAEARGRLILTLAEYLARNALR